MKIFNLQFKLNKFYREGMGLGFRFHYPCFVLNGIGDGHRMNGYHYWSLNIDLLLIGINISNSRGN